MMHALLLAPHMALARRAVVPSGAAYCACACFYSSSSGGSGSSSSSTTTTTTSVLGITSNVLGSTAHVSLAFGSTSRLPAPETSRLDLAWRFYCQGGPGQMYITRGYAGRAHKNIQRPVFELPPNIKSIVDAKHEEMKVRKLPEPVAPPLEPRPLQRHSIRTGAIAIKAGMTQEWDEWGVRVPLTVLFMDDVQVVGIKNKERNGYVALQVGASYAKQKSLPGASAGFYIAQGVPFKRKMVEFPVSADAVLPVGTYLSAAHFVPGQKVDVTGWTKDKGFQGVMKRWGFKGMPATHGTSLSHRKPGSVGACQDPGRVWKGKKMPGQMGKERRTVHGCTVYKVDPQRHLVYVRGQVPGPAGAYVYIRDALNVKYDDRLVWNLPFPTSLADPASLAVRVWKKQTDPYRMYSEETDYFPINWKKGGD